MFNLDQFKHFWENDLCPIINGIIYANGTIKILNPKTNMKNEYEYLPDFCGVMTIYEMSQKSEIQYTNIMKRQPIEVNAFNLLIYCGEGSWGGEGFVAVCERLGSSEKLNWIAYFDYSNPMERIEYQNNKIIAYSILGRKWVFDIENPEKVEVDFG